MTIANVKTGAGTSIENTEDVSFRIRDWPLAVGDIGVEGVGKFTRRSAERLVLRRPRSKKPGGLRLSLWPKGEVRQLTDAAVQLLPNCGTTARQGPSLRVFNAFAANQSPYRRIWDRNSEEGSHRNERFPSRPSVPWKSLERFPHSHSPDDGTLSQTYKQQNQGDISTGLRQFQSADVAIAFRICYKAVRLLVAGVRRSLLLPRQRSAFSRVAA